MRYGKYNPTSVDFTNKPFLDYDSSLIQVRPIKRQDDCEEFGVFAMVDIPSDVELVIEQPFCSCEGLSTAEWAQAIVHRLENKNEDQDLSDIAKYMDRLYPRKVVPHPSYQGNILEEYAQKIDATGFKESKDKTRSLLFRFTSHFNHGCMSNAHIDLDSQGRAIVVTHSKIPEGTEVCISYRNYTGDHFERKVLLKRKFGFECQCDLCCGRFLVGAKR